MPSDAPLAARKILVVASLRDERARLSAELHATPTTIYAESGADAIAILTELPDLTAIVTSLELGDGISGFDVLRAARRQNPTAVRCLTTTDDHTFVAVDSDIVDMVFIAPWLPGAIASYLARRWPR
jgi:CheY-like chemotaxis protein